MGEYEPEDSRKVTHDPNKDAAGLKPTGSQEDAARDEAIRRQKIEEAEARGEDLSAGKGQLGGKPGGGPGFAAEGKQLGKDGGPKSGGADYGSDTGKPAGKY